MKIDLILKIIMISFLLIFSDLEGQNKKINYSFIAKGLEWKGVAVQDSNYSLWGCAPIQGNEGKNTFVYCTMAREKCRSCMEKII